MAIEPTDVIDVKSLTPFKKFIMTIGNLPTSYLESMTYSEMLMWFCNYLQETVIPTVNNNAEAVEELQDLYEELRTYVNDYFENLDVQEEIDKKLDSMASDGSLTNLIKQYVDPYIAVQNTRIDNLRTEVESIASGSPLVASSTSGMTDTSRVYVNTSDGNWYYYDGDSWEVGGVYQASEDSDTLTELNGLVDTNRDVIDYVTEYETGLVKTDWSTTTNGRHYIYTDFDEGDTLQVTSFYYNPTFPLALLDTGDHNSSSVKQAIRPSTDATFYENYEFTIPSGQGITEVIVNDDINHKIIITNKNKRVKISDYVKPLEDNVDEINGILDTEKDFNIDITYETGLLKDDITLYSSTGRHCAVEVHEGEVYKVTSYFYNNTFPFVICNDGTGKGGNTLVVRPTTADKNYYDYEITIPGGTDVMYINTNPSFNIILKQTKKDTISNYINVNNDWHNKKVAWLGTSIPECGGKINNYPKQVCDNLGAIVTNKAIGSSSMHCKDYQRINDSNPYGFRPDWNNCSKCLTNSIVEMQWLIAHYNNGYFFNAPESLSEADQTAMLSASYENLIMPTINDYDVYVFDHGHNDVFNQNTINGVPKTDEEVCEILGDDNLYTFEGAMNFIIRKIKSANAKTRILIIGEIQNKVNSVYSIHQEKIADIWSVPICKTWEMLGWTDQTITTTGYWNNTTGLWVESGGPEQTISLFDRFVRDGIHPHTDNSNYAMNWIAKNITSWARNIEIK